MNLQYVQCGLCGEDKTHLVYVERGFNIVECASCGLVYVNPRFPDHLYKAKTNLSYKEVVTQSLEANTHPKDLNKNDLDRKAYLCLRNKESAVNLRQVQRYSKRKGTLLDVGCGEGFFLKAASDAGWEVAGVEMSVTHKPSPELKLNILNEDFLNVDLPEKMFDAVTFYDVLEHLPYPRETLQKAQSLLKEGGLLVIRVPNEKFLRLKTRIIAALFGKDFYLRNKNLSILGYYAPETHLYNFNQETLGLLLRNSGFKVFGIHLGKFAMGKGAIRYIVHSCMYLTAKLLYTLSLGRLNYNCSITVFAKKNSSCGTPGNLI